MNLNLFLAIKHPPIALWKTGLMNSFVDDGHSKTRSVKVVQKLLFCLNIDAMRELIMQDRYVTYREIEASLSISSTSIYSSLHEHLAVKKFGFCWIAHNLTIWL